MTPEELRQARHELGLSQAALARRGGGLHRITRESPMISDTLSDAAAQIREYLKAMPEVYAPVKAEVETVLASMDALRCALDAPPLGLYEELLAAGLSIDHHESDLYTRDTPEARGLCAKHGRKFSTFQSQIDGQQWLDIAFAYTPWWEARKARTLRGAQ